MVAGCWRGSLTLTIPQNKNPFHDMMPEEIEPYLREQVTRIQNSSMWQQSPENPGLLTPTQQLEWFELLAREETVRLLQDSSRTMWGDNRCVRTQLPLRIVPEAWSKVFARLPKRLAKYTTYPYDKRREFAYHYGPDGLDAVETIIREFLKEADAQLFPMPGESASSRGEAAMSEKDRELYRFLGHEHICTTNDSELWRTNRSQLGLRREDNAAFRARLYRIRGAANLPSSKSISTRKKKSVQP